MVPCTDLDSDGKNQVQRPSLWLWHSCWLSYNPAYKSNLKNNHQNEHDHRHHWYLKRLIVNYLRQSQVGFVFHPKEKDNDEWVAAYKIVDSYWQEHRICMITILVHVQKKTSPATLTSILTNIARNSYSWWTKYFNPSLVWKVPTDSWKLG